MNEPMSECGEGCSSQVGARFEGRGRIRLVANKVHTQLPPAGRSHLIDLGEDCISAHAVCDLIEYLTPALCECRARISAMNIGDLSHD